MRKFERIWQIERELQRAFAQKDQATADRLIKAWRREERRLTAIDPAPGWTVKRARQLTLF